MMPWPKELAHLGDTIDSLQWAGVRFLWQVGHFAGGRSKWGAANVAEQWDLVGSEVAEPTC